MQFRAFLAPLAILLLGGCETGGLSCGSPIPTPPLPPDQTIEGGSQIRLTPSGLGKVTANAQASVATVLAPGFCISRMTFGTPPFDATACASTDGTCMPGCH